MGRSCIHFECRFCGRQERCLDAELAPDEFLTCKKGHVVLVNEAERQKINMAFKSYVGTRIEVFL